MSASLFTVKIKNWVLKCFPLTITDWLLGDIRYVRKQAQRSAKKGHLALPELGGWRKARKRR